MDKRCQNCGTTNPESANTCAQCGTTLPSAPQASANSYQAKHYQPLFQNPFSFKGRIRRLEYGISIIIYSVMFTIIGMILTAIIISNGGSQLDIYYATWVIQLPFLWFTWAQGAKRCHDMGMSGWFQLIPFFSIYMLFAKGEEGENKYGHNPKGY